ncbi:hypothetical protein NAT51_08085 [Flavobacterium amniphilum]|uniref:hypothetical protein n=1 Tax=Flavobacterium amniphilum TaxID=1834035 RepID=UPI00202A3371|nr:hypothetical protein [Flavobacterium amniphilum]MCL9805477.1 hypothetical protein [Flavobacterium amniphilum]
MRLNVQNKTTLEKSGIVVLENDNRCMLLKKTGINGNRLPNYRSIPIATLDENGEITEGLTSDCPVMNLWYNKDHFLLSCWNWVPGPGPGDFEKEFTDQDELVKFIISYYFGSNEYFEARKKYEEGRENGG